MKLRPYHVCYKISPYWVSHNVIQAYNREDVINKWIDWNNKFTNGRYGKEVITFIEEMFVV